jgi:hypothetical protein
MILFPDRKCGTRKQHHGNVTLGLVLEIDCIFGPVVVTALVIHSQARCRQRRQMITVSAATYHQLASVVVIQFLRQELAWSRGLYCRLPETGASHL